MEVTATVTANHRYIELRIDDVSVTTIILLDAEEASQLAAEIDASVNNIRAYP